MYYLSIILIAIGLAMDTFSVSITEGFRLKYINKSQIFIIAFLFGIFHFLMPIIGWVSGNQIRVFISFFAPTIAFILLAGIGCKMIYDSLTGYKQINNDFSYKNLFLLAFATSIDAFAVGISFSFFNLAIIFPVIIIGIVTFIFSEIGILIGQKMGHIFGDKLEVFGGLILILIGLKIFFGF